jgi:hydroxyethylthiazole kinase-like uncharacterized protein yjeF
MSTGVFDVATVRAAEQSLMAHLPEGALMHRAAMGLEVIVAEMLEQVRGRVVGSAIVALIGSGNNGGDALWAATGWVRRGAGVLAITYADTWHSQAMRAFLRAGGRVVAAQALEESTLATLLADADVVVDGIIGIGGRGPLRGQAARTAAAIADGAAIVVAVDIPSGVDADTGHVGDASACIRADITVTFGCLKPGLLLAPGRFFTGAVRAVDIGLRDHLPSPECQVLDELDVALAVPEPEDADYKYSRGVVCVAAGSSRYPGAAYLAVGGARYAGAGMVRYLARSSNLADSIAARFPDVVVTDDVADIGDDRRVSACAVGPGWGRDQAAADILGEIVDLAVPVVIDADALRLVADNPQLLSDRTDRGALRVITPHEGEFAALGFSIGDDRLAAARHAAATLGCVVVLKGPGTVIATPEGEAFIDVFGTADLGTAGSGDVLTGLIAGMLASHQARHGQVTMSEAGHIAAAAVGLHGIAGRGAARNGRPVTASDIAEHLPDAIARVRRG